MSAEKLPDDFVASLLSQEDLFGSEKFEGHRRELIRKLDEAALREKKARRRMLAAGLMCGLIFALLYTLAIYGAGQTENAPEALAYAVALIVILSPTTVLILAAIYFFRYRLTLLRARKEARDQALQEVPRQLAELRKDIEQLRQQLAASKAKGGFTLTEMLVTIGVLGILTSLTFPAFSGAKLRARTIECASNLRQQTQALAMYEGDFHYFPGSGDPVVPVKGPPWGYRSSNSWAVLITPYLSGASNVFLCPSYQAPFSAAFNMSHDSFGYNAGGSAELNVRSSTLGLGYGNSNYIGAAAIVSPSEMITLGDVQFPSSVWANYIGTWSRYPIGGLDSVIPTRHSKGSNMSFVDTHIEWRKRPQWIDARNALRARWNNDHQPHRESWR